MLRRNAGKATLTAFALLLSNAAPAVATVGVPHRYDNPVSASFADTFADPMVIRGLDGSPAVASFDHLRFYRAR